MTSRALIGLLVVALSAYAAGVLLPSPLGRLGVGGGVPVVRIPLVTEARYAVRWIDGVDATLVASGLPAARVPRAWLPPEVRVGDRVRVSTEIDLDDLETELRIRLEAPSVR